VDANAYFASLPWAVLEEINAELCRAGRYQVGRTSDGYEPTKKMWNSRHASSLTILEAARLCRECHTLAPFLFLNGNTFVSCARIALEPAWQRLAAAQAASLRSAGGHFIAGTISQRELEVVLASTA
jgi:hypothetical protein